MVPNKLPLAAASAPACFTAVPNQPFAVCLLSFSHGTFQSAARFLNGRDSLDFGMLRAMPAEILLLTAIEPSLRRLSGSCCVIAINFRTIPTNWRKPQDESWSEGRRPRGPPFTVAGSHVGAIQN
jgi:hypothetical protein